MDAIAPNGNAARQHWMSVLAKASSTEILSAWNDLEAKPQYRFLRAPETGLVMVQARAGGTGQRFNFGEMTMTKCIVELDDGTHGHAYIAGSDPAHAEIAAVLDGVLQIAAADTPVDAPADAPADAPVDAPVMTRIIGPLAQTQGDRKRQQETKAAATRVDFFTLVRGEDE